MAAPPPTRATLSGPGRAITVFATRGSPAGGFMTGAFALPEPGASAP